jgi:hypothetical protein
MNDNRLQHKVIRTGSNSWSKSCISCGHEFKAGEIRNEWRLLFTDRFWDKGSFWTIQCDECFVKTVINWRDLLNNKLEELVQ